SLQTDNLGMAMLTENKNLLILIVRGLDTVLQLQHYRTGSINKGNIIFQGYAIRFGCLSMGTNQHLLILQGRKNVMVNDTESLCLKPRHLLIIMHNISQTIQIAVLF